MNKNTKIALGAIAAIVLAVFGYKMLVKPVEVANNNNNAMQTPAQTQAASTTNEIPSNNFVDSDTTRTSVDWNGDYAGKVACASCEYIDTKLTLKSDDTYSLSEKYVGGKSTGEVFTESGKITWDQAGSVITLVDAKTKENRVFFVTEGKVIMLGADQKLPTGPIADSYTLKKVK